MNISIYQPLSIHEQGQRKNQEDAIWPADNMATADDRLFVLCDGMGGHAKGEVASQTVSQALGHWFQRHTDSSKPLDDNQLAEALAYTYEQLDARDDGSPKKMGTTLTLLYLHRQGATAAHIGDSRIYHIRPAALPADALRYISRDHSLVYDLFEAGVISYDEIQTSNRKNVITRAMQPGADQRMKPDVIHITDVVPGDWFYLCSDGMMEQMGHTELAALLTGNGSDEEKRQQLLAATTNNHDNHTAWLIHVKDVEHEEADKALANEEPTARCNALTLIPIEKANDNASVTVPQQADQKTAIQPRGKQRRWVVWMVAALVLAAVLAVAVFLLWPKQPAPDKTRKAVEKQLMSGKKQQEAIKNQFGARKKEPDKATKP